MPQVQVKLYATLREYVGRAPSVTVDVAPGQTVRTVLAQLGVPADRAAIIFVNDCPAELDHALQGDEQIGVFPVMGGG